MLYSKKCCRFIKHCSGNTLSIRRRRRHFHHVKRHYIRKQTRHHARKHHARKHTKKHHARKTGKKIAINATIGQKINLIASLKKNSLKRRKHVLKRVFISKKTGKYCKKLKKCNRCCERKKNCAGSKKKCEKCRKCCKHRVYCSLSKKHLKLKAHKVKIASKKLKKAYLVQKKNGLFMCENFIRCGCKGIKRKERTSKHCCREVNVCHRHKKIQIIKKIKHHKKVSFQKLPQKATRKSAKYFKNKGCKCHLNRKCRIIRK